jgi:hypothetical protein
VSTNTPNYNLVKPSGNPPETGGDLVDVAVINSNMDTIDTALHDHEIRVADLELRANNWVTDYASATSYSFTVTSTAGTYEVPTGGGPYSVDVPNNKTLEVEYAVPLVSVPGGTGLRMKIEVGGTVIAAGYVSNSGSSAFALPIFLRGEYVGTGVSVDINVKACRDGASNPNINADSIPPLGVIVRHRIS